jgi:putative CocE/NonD family hydrolase
MAISTRQRLADAALSRMLTRSKALGGYTVGAVRTPMRDGVTLAGDHFAPDPATSRGTVLIRTPYGRGFPTSALNGRFLAGRGYHVLVQSVRGTFGSGGTFQPMAQEMNDGQDTIAWLREQPWFDGRLATLGASYLGWAQWTILRDPPPELRTAVIYVGPHDFREAVFGTGAFTLGDFLGWSDQIAHQEDGGNLRRLLNTVTAGRRVRPAFAGLPLPDAAEPVLRGRAPWYREWLSHPSGDDPWWEPYRAGSALQTARSPILLVGGWQDLFLEQTLSQYAALRARDVEVGLTVGPWTHVDVAVKAAAQVARETADWLDQHLAGDGSAARKSPVRVYRTGENRWHELTEWPPASSPVVFQLHADRTLTTAVTGPPVTHFGADTTIAAEPAPAETVTFRYDPADPTPSLGGRTLSGSTGVKDNRVLEARPDVVTFTTDPLPTAVDVIGSPVLELAVAVDHPDADLFLRLCDVDERGRSRNFSDHLQRLDPAAAAGEIRHLRLTLDPCFHRLLAGHRLRLQISGGAFPRYARNLGLPGTPAESRAMQATYRTVYCDQSRLTLPVAGPDVS